MRTRPLLALLVLVVIGAVGIALYRGFGPIPGPTGCTTKVKMPPTRQRWR